MLESEDPRIRAAAVRVLSDWSHPDSDLDHPLAMKLATELFRRSIRDEHPRVRLEAVRGVTNLRSGEAAEIALTVLDRRMDRFSITLCG